MPSRSLAFTYLRRNTSSYKSVQHSCIKPLGLMLATPHYRYDLTVQYEECTTVNVLNKTL